MERQDRTIDHSVLEQSLRPWGLVVRGVYPNAAEVVILVDGQEKRFPVEQAVITVDNTHPTERIVSTMLVPPRRILEELTGRTDF